MLMSCAINEGDESLDEENNLSLGLLLESCLGSVIFDKESRTVRLVHYSLDEYLRRTGRISADRFRTGTTLLGVNVLRISLSSFLRLMYRAGQNFINEKCSENLNSLRLLEYAACY